MSLEIKAQEINESDHNEDKYLLFSLAGDLFGTPLSGVREVIEPQPVKDIPNTPSNFLGVINLRGEIVGVTDLRLRFNREAKESGRNTYIIFETSAGAIGALVDNIEPVVDIAKEDLDEKPSIASTLPQEYLIGIAKTNDRLVTVIDLAKVLSSEEVNFLRNTKLDLES